LQGTDVVEQYALRWV